MFNSKFRIKNLKLVFFVVFLMLTCVGSGYAEVGDKVTLELQGVNILDVFKILSKQSGLNIVAGRNVQGQVSIFLKEVPVRDALRTILESQGLASVEEGHIIKVIREEEYLRKYGKPYDDRRETQSFKLEHARASEIVPQIDAIKSEHGKVVVEPRTNTVIVTELPEIQTEIKTLIEASDQPFVTEAFYLRYADVEALEEKLQPLFEGSASRLEIDPRANRMVVSGTQNEIENVRFMVESFDVPMPQVLIEAKIVEVRLSDSYRRGINWEHLIQEAGRFDTIAAAAPLAVSPPLGTSALSTLVLGSDSDDLQVVIDLLERVGKTNLLSSPRLTALNRQEAKLAVATREPFVSQTVVQTSNSTNTADNVQFVDVGVTLTVEPRISHDHYVELHIKPEVSSSNQSLELQGVAPGSETTFTRSRIPIVTTQELETTVLVKSGTTIIVGGLIQDKKDKQSSKVPILGSIPLVGRAFQSKAHDYTKTELVTFITPTILYPEENAPEVPRFFNEKNELAEFSEVGDYPYRPTYLEPLRHAKVGEVPYWEEVY